LLGLDSVVPGLELVMQPLESVMRSGLELWLAGELGVGFLVEFGLEMALALAPVVTLLGLPLALATPAQNSLLPLALGSELVEQKERGTATECWLC